MQHIKGKPRKVNLMIRREELAHLLQQKESDKDRMLKTLQKQRFPNPKKVKANLLIW
jgi:hypothetical protein